MNAEQRSVSQSWLHPSRLLLIAIIIFLIAYVVLRAIYVSITHDEAYTFFNYIRRPIGSTLDITYTNNHLLNSLLARFSSNLWGDSEFSLRLPNVIGAAAFFIFGARLLRQMHANGWLILAAFVALAFNTFVIDFFGLCRGYGISLGLLMASMFYMHRSFCSERVWLHQSIALSLTGAAVLANYTLFNFFLLQAAFILILGAIRLISYRNEKRKLLRGLLTGYLPLVVCCVLFTNYTLGMLLRLKELGNLNFGGSEGFWADTVGSLSMFSCFPILYGNDWIWQLYTPVLAGIILFFSAIICIRALMQRTFSPNEMFMLFLFSALVGCAVALILQHQLMDIPFSRDRTVIYFIPLFSLLAISLLFNQDRYKRWHRIAVLLFFLPTIAAQAANFNLRKVNAWYGDEGMEEAVNMIIERARQNPGEKKRVEVAAPYNISPSLNYYLYVNNCRNIQPILFAQAEWWMFSDFCIYDTTTENILPDLPYEIIGTVASKLVMQRKTSVNYEAVRQLGFVDFEANAQEGRPYAMGYNSASSDSLYGDHKFSVLIRDSVTDSVGIENVYVLSCYLLARQIPVQVHAVMCVTRAGQIIMWKVYDCVAYLKNSNEWQEAAFFIHPDFGMQPGDVIEFYVVQDGDPPVQVDDFSVTQFKVQK